MRYNPALDGIRTLAVVAVMAFHSRVPGLAGGYLGVDIFFVLSGFLITSLLMDEHAAHGRIDLGRFYLRRLLRLTPPLFALLACYLVLAPILQPEVPIQDHWRDAAIAGMYLSDYAVAFWNIPGLLKHTWSLAVEEHFYLVWPAVLLGIFALPTQRTRILALLGLYVLTTVWRWHCDAEMLPWREIYTRFDTRVSGLVLGAVIAYVLHITPTTQIKSWGAGVCLVVLGYFLVAWDWRQPGTFVYGITLVELATAGLIVHLAGNQSTGLYRVLGSRPMAYLGRLSYGLYLWHYPVMFMLRKHYDWQATFLLGSVCALLLAMLSYHTLEEAVRRYRQRLTLATASAA